MTAKVRVIPATSVFLNVLGDDTMESIPENMMEAAEIRKTAPITGLGIPARIYAILGQKP